MPIQGTAARHHEDRDDRLRARLRDEGLRARLLLQVHDELVLEVRRATRWTTSCPPSCETMEGALTLDVPLTVDVKVGDDWESMTPSARE